MLISLSEPMLSFFIELLVESISSPPFDVSRDGWDDGDGAEGGLSNAKISSMLNLDTDASFLKAPKDCPRL